MASAAFAEFETPEALLAAAKRLREIGCTRLEGFTPYPMPELEAVIGLRRSRIPAFVLAGGLTGGGLAYLLQWFVTAVDFPLDVGGRPLHSAPAFIPITFEMTVLGAAIAGFVGLLVMCGLPRLHHPVFEIEGFESVNVDCFWLAVEAGDPLLETGEVQREFAALGASRVVEIP